MSQQWNENELQRYISQGIEENSELDYKAAKSLGKQNDKTGEITKDVSAMANSAGGVIIYGITEHTKPNNHLPEKIDPIDRSQFSKEWLEQIISQIRPKLDCKIIPVPLTSSPNDEAYVVEIPQGHTAHQAKDYRYYERYNFEAVPMADYEIRDVMNRAMQFPTMTLEFVAGIGKSVGATLNLKSTVCDYQEPSPLSYQASIRLAAHGLALNANTIADDVKYIQDTELIRPVQFTIKNGPQLAEKVMACFWIEKQHGLTVVKDSDYPSKGISVIAGLMSTDYRIVEAENHWAISVDFGTLRPQINFIPKGCFYIGSTEPTTLDVEATIFGNNIREPINVSLQINIEVAHRTIDNSELTD